MELQLDCFKNKRSIIYSNASIILVFGFLFFISLQSSAQSQSSNSNKLVLQLKWKNQFQFAGYYAAAEKGYYKTEGLDVEIRELEKSTSSISNVLKGEAQYGIANSELVIQFMNGEPLVVLACIMQNSPSALLVKASTNINDPKELKGKIIEIDKEQSGIEIMIMLTKEGLTAADVNTLESTFSLNNLLANKIDALEVYTTNEPYFLDKFGIEYRMFLPRNYGINFYSDCLFTTQEEARKHPERVRKFRNASIKGWKYALEHPEEMINIIQTKYHSTKTSEHLLIEADEMRKLINPEFIEVGHSNKERWLNIVETLWQQGFINHYRDISEFIYDPDKYDSSRNNRALMIIVLVLIIGIVSLVYFVLKYRKSILIYSDKIYHLTQRNELQREEIKRLNTEAKKHNEKASN